MQPSATVRNSAMFVDFAPVFTNTGTSPPTASAA
jgi:hypothetical protein